MLTGGGTVREPIARHPVDRKRMSVQQNGKPSVTHYTVKERFAAFTYVNVKLETGPIPQQLTSAQVFALSDAEKIARFRAGNRFT